MPIASVGKSAFDVMGVVLGLWLLVGPISVAKAAGWYITNCVATGTESSTVNGVTTSSQWPSPGKSFTTSEMAGDGEYLNVNTGPLTYSMSVVGSAVFTLKWLNPDKSPGVNPPSSLVLAVTPYAAADSPPGSSANVDDGYGDPQTYEAVIQGMMGGYGNASGYLSGYTMLNGTELPHTELIQVQAANGVATYSTQTVTSEVSGVAMYPMEVMGDAAVARVTVSIDNRAIALSRPGAHDEWQDPSDPYITHGDTTYSYSQLNTGIDGSLITTPQHNTQTWAPVFIGSWHSVPPISYAWYPSNSASTWNNGLWVIADGGQTEYFSPDDQSSDGDWSKAPQPVSGYMQYSATDSDNATYVGIYDVNVHPLTEPFEVLSHQVWGVPVTFGDPNNGNLRVVVPGPCTTAPSDSYSVSYTESMSVQIAPFPIETILQNFGVTYPGQVSGSIGYSKTTKSTSGVGNWKSLLPDQEEYITETCMFDRYVHFYRVFDEGGEDITKNSAGQPIYHENVTDQGPISVPALLWKVVPMGSVIPAPGPLTAIPVSQDTQMPTIPTYNPHTP